LRNYSSANGCTDNTLEYLGNLKEKFNYLRLEKHLKIVWDNNPLGYPKATNAGIKVATTDKIVLLNNDAVLLPQNKNNWLSLLNDGFDQSNCGITAVLLKYSEITKRNFGIFFCVMIHRKVFDKIGLLNEDYGTGSGEDIEFCMEAELAGFSLIQPVQMVWSNEAMLHVGTFPIYHRGEGTVHDPNLVQNWNQTFKNNELRLAKKYNLEWYEANKHTGTI
jgi:GT2 family glycosyltransferase